jgi:hypothetical protein
MPCRRFFVLIGLIFPPTAAGHVVKALVDYRVVAGRAVNRINSAIRGSCRQPDQHAAGRVHRP